MDSSKNERWTNSFKEFSKVTVQNHTAFINIKMTRTKLS